MTTPRLLVASNGHGEDGIACRIIEALRSCAPDLYVTSWPMVGAGDAYRSRGIAIEGPSNTLPSEGFGTISGKAFLRDLRAGFIGTYLRQLSHARGLRGRHDLILAVGDVVPLAAGYLSGVPYVFVSCAKSSWYGRKMDHDAVDRWLMRRAAAVFPRDPLTVSRLKARGVPAEDAGNPMMDGLEASAILLSQDEIGIAMLAGSRRDAVQNATDLLAGAGRLALQHDAPGRLRFLFAAAGALDPSGISLPEGWQDVAPDGDARRLSHRTGAVARILTGRFNEVLASSRIAVGMAGTANEQAVGLGLPLVNLPARGNQGLQFWRLKTRYFGEAAIPARSEPDPMAAAIRLLLDQPERYAAMIEAGRVRMGAPGASARIADRVLAELGAA